MGNPRNLLAVTPDPVRPPFPPSVDGGLNVEPGTVQCFDWSVEQLLHESLSSGLTRVSQLTQFCLKGFSAEHLFFDTLCLLIFISTVLELRKKMSPPDASLLIFHVGVTDVSIEHIPGKQEMFPFSL